MPEKLSQEELLKKIQMLEDENTELRQIEIALKESELGKGTFFRVFFPLLDSRAVDSEKELETSLPGGTEFILFVDDEEALIKIGKGILERMGYHVITCLDGMEALAVFKEQPDRFDLVITDMTMPYMTGIELSNALISIRPDIPIILSTGFSEGITPVIARENGIRELFQKPYGIRSMAELVRKVLDETSSS